MVMITRGIAVSFTFIFPRPLSKATRLLYRGAELVLAKMTKFTSLEGFRCLEGCLPFLFEEVELVSVTILSS